jgi:Holliday junction resolvase RusA-like endonuclease
MALMEPILLTVYGSAQPAGSKDPFMRKDGTMGVRDANPRAREWKDAVAAAAGREYDGPLLTQAVRLELSFYRPWLSGHFSKRKGREGELRDGAPVYPITAPDLTKLIRGTEDALKGIVFRDDAQVCEQHTRKLFGTPARVEIRVVPLGDPRVGELRQPRLTAAM